MAQIHVLDTVTANKIAAGEVVERPESVIKELIENAIDAGATEVEVEIAEGGVRYIRVTDDGSGMSEEDARLAFIRHATSKIRTVEDIFAVSSLGFRGEALPSIASVAKVRLTTREKDAATGFFLQIDGGKELDSGEMGAPAGTTIEVQDLFFNTPARKKFLKTERTESGRINTLVSKIAMAHANVAFRLINNGRTVIETPGNGNLMDAIAMVYGTELTEDVFPIEGEAEGLTIHGVVGKPSVLKGSRHWQTFVVNHRVIESPLLARALDNAYHSLLPKSGYPVAVLLLDVDPEVVDVNVHPQKREIKFENEQLVFRAVYHAILSGLTQVDKPEQVATEIRQTPAAVKKDTERTIQQANAQQSEGVPSSFTPIEDSPAFMDKGEKLPPQQATFHKKSEAFRGSGEFTGNVAEPGAFTDFVETHNAPPAGTENLLFTTSVGEEQPLIPLGQIAKCFIICQKGDELYIIDQHAAHERIRYDKLSEATEGIPSQKLLVPIMIQMELEEVNALLDNEAIVQELGFKVEQVGPKVVRLSEAPADTDNEENERILREIAQALNTSQIPTSSQLRHRVLAYASCRGAIKAGHVLNMRQMRQLVQDLFHTSRPFVCPHGRPVIVRFTAQDLANLFNRT